jgi:lycopene beta-cyclase
MTGVVLAGGGLANSLIAWRLRTRRPDVPVVVVDREQTLGGNHTWSFHEEDVSAEQLAWLRPLVAHYWAGQTVRFPRYQRRLSTPYHSITSERLHETVAAALEGRTRLGCAIAGIEPGSVRLASGETLTGDLVIDGRGAPALDAFDLRWQKFLGVELELVEPHGIDVPLLMDATVAQRDGYRFVYVLPLAPQRLLIEDTYYSDTPELRLDQLRAEVRGYAAQRGFQVKRVVREETGVLPIVLGGNPQAFWRGADDRVPRSGMAAMLCHHTTGYSLPDAARLADLIAAAPELSSSAIAALVRDYALRRWREQGFFRMLNRLMFDAARPGERYLMLQHFYRLPDASISRFYAGRLSLQDRLRILSGRPPVPVSRALRCLARGLLPGFAGGRVAQGGST